MKTLNLAMVATILAVNLPAGCASIGDRLPFGFVPNPNIPEDPKSPCYQYLVNSPLPPMMRRSRYERCYVSYGASTGRASPQMEAPK